MTVYRLWLCLLAPAVPAPPSMTSPVSAFITTPRETRRLGFCAGLGWEALASGLKVTRWRAWAAAVAFSIRARKV